MDDGEKIRRNLVTICFYIIISHWLSFSLLDIFSLKTSISIEHRKYIVSIWVVYVYFLARYRWSDDYCSEMKLREGKYKKSVSELLKPRLMVEAKRFSHLGINGNWRGIFHRFQDVNPVAASIPESIKILKDMGGQGELVIKMLPEKIDDDVSWSGYVPGYYAFSMHQNANSIGEDYQISAMVGYSFPLWWIFIQWLKLRFFLAAYSKHGLEVQVPVYIALVANGVLVQQTALLFK